MVPDQGILSDDRVTGCNRWTGLVDLIDTSFVVMALPCPASGTWQVQLFNSKSAFESPK